MFKINKNTLLAMTLQGDNVTNIKMSFNDTDDIYKLQKTVDSTLKLRMCHVTHFNMINMFFCIFVLKSTQRCLMPIFLSLFDICNSENDKIKYKTINIHILNNYST